MMLLLYAKDQIETFDKEIGYNYSLDFPYLHAHDYWEFVFTVREVSHFHNGRTTTLRRDSVSIIKPSDSHYLKKLSDSENSPTHLNIKASDSLVRSLTGVIDENMYDKMLAADNLLNKPFSKDAANKFSKFISTILWCLDKNITVILLKTMLSEMVLYFHDEIYKSDHMKHMNIPVIIQNILTKMNISTYMQCNLAELTKDSNYSYMHLCRLFKKYTNSTMSDYFMNIKLNYACEMLKTTNKSVLEIANDIGIYSLSHFDHIFKEKYKTTPLKYRMS